MKTDDDDDADDNDQHAPALKLVARYRSVAKTFKLSGVSVTWRAAFSVLTT